MPDFGSGGFLRQQRHIILVGGPSTDKCYIAIAIVRNCIRAGKKARFFDGFSFNLRDLYAQLAHNASLRR